MNLLQMSISGAILILAIALVRPAALRAVSKRTFLLLWALVLIRLLIPFPALLRLPIPLPEPAARPAAAVRTPDPESMPLPSTVTAAPAASAPAVTASPVQDPPKATPAPDLPSVTAAPSAARPAAAVPAGAEPTALSGGFPLSARTRLLIWLPGMGITAAVFAVLYAVSYRRFRRAVPLEGTAAEAWLAAHPAKRKLRLRTLTGLSSPLTYGVFHPVILLPEGLNPAEESAAFALEHEYVHARRLDALWKLLLALTLAVHWFNPCVWLMWFLANRDLELSCDEEVLRRFGREQRGSYARALLAMEEKRSLLPPLHSGFGSGTTRERILSIMKYKKATVLSVVLAAVLVAALAACALSGRKTADEGLSAPGADLTVGPVRWGMSENEARKALKGAKKQEDGSLTLETDFCGVPAAIRWLFAENEGERFLNGIEITFADDEKGANRKAMTEVLEEAWGGRIKYEPADMYAPGLDSTFIASKGNWYWRTEDCSDEFGWKSGVTARFVNDTETPTLRIDATGRNQAAGRLTELPDTPETRKEVQRLFYMAGNLRPSALSWGWGKTGHDYDTSRVQVYTEEDRAFAEKLFAPYPWMTVECLGDQYTPADVSDVVLDGTLVPARAEVSRDRVFEEVTADFVNRTDKALTLVLPVGIYAQRPEGWVRPEGFERGYDWANPVVEPGESYPLSWRLTLQLCGYEFAPGVYMLTVFAFDNEAGDWDMSGGVRYGALVTVTEEGAESTAAADGYARLESGGYTLSVPAEYADKLTVETEQISDYWEILFNVTETASYEAGQKLSPGNDDGWGWLFSIVQVSEDELGKMMMWDMSGVQCFARTETGDYLLLVQPTDLRFVPTDASGKWQEQWDALDGWGRNAVTDRFLEDNSSLTPCRHGDSFLENALARVLYYDPAEYGEAGRALIRYGDSEGADPMGTSQAREIAHRMLWEYSMEGAAAAKDFPESGASVTLTDPLGIELTFREDSDVVRVTYNGDTHQYFRLKSLLLHGNPIGSMACGWYFDAAATLSGETATYKNGDFTLRLPAEYAYQLLVETPEEGEALFKVYEKDSRRRWDASSDHSGDTTDGWLFSILRMERDAWGSWIIGGDSGVYMFAQDGVKYCYLCSYPIWRTFRPEDGKTVDRESEASRQYSTLTAALRHFDIELYFTSDNNLAVSRFTGAQQYFLDFAIYGYDDCAIRQGPDGEPYDPRMNDQALYYLKLLLWEVEYEAAENILEPAGEPILVENGSAKMLFWKDGDIAALENSGGRQYYACKARGAENGNRAYVWAATCLDMARIGAALPPTSGGTVHYTSQGLTLAIPEEYDELLIVDTEPAQQGALFRVMQRSSWENGQKAHPGEDRGDGLLFVVYKVGEEGLIWELRANPTPVSLAGRDREGNYYLIGYPSDVRFVGEDPQIITPSDPGLPEWQALNHWAAGAGEAFCAANGDTLLPMEKAFCELEHVLAVLLGDGTEAPLPEYFRFVSPEGAVTEGAEVPERFDYARRILLEGSSRWLPEDTPAPEGRPIRLETPGGSVNSRLLFTFWPGSDIFREEFFYSENGAHSSRLLRMTLPKDGPNIGYLMARWYGKAAEDVVHHLTAEIVGYGNDTICIKVTEPGDSRLAVGFEMYVGGFYLSEDGEYTPVTDLPVGCIVEVEYSGEVVADEFGYCGPTGGPSGYVRMAEP